MSTRALGPQFHATTAELKPGEKIVPGAEIGKRNYDWHDNSVVYSSTDFHQVRELYGHSRHGVLNTRIYEVEPDPATVKSTWAAGGEHTSAHAIVKRKVYDIKAGLRPHYSQARGLHDWGADCAADRCHL